MNFVDEHLSETCILYKEREMDVARKLGVSNVTLRNWVGLKYTTDNINCSTLKQNPNRNEIDLSESQGGNVLGKDIPNFYAALDEPKGIIENANELNYSSAHCLHQNIETLAQYLIEKIDTLQRTQLDIHHIEIITDRVFHNIEKLKNETRVNNSYVQSLENKNRSLEAKIDVLLMQNEAISQKCTQFELLGERFFSKNLELENKLLALEHKFNFPDIYESVSEHIPKTKITTDLVENELYDDEESQQLNTIENHYEKEVETKALNELYNPKGINYQYTSEPEPQNNHNIDNLLQSKKEVEEFIKQKYPEDYRRIKQYNKKSFKKWFTKVLGIN
jgi:hypothetical protein